MAKKPTTRLALLPVLILSACTGSDISGTPLLGEADLRVAFLGNSLTYVEDVPMIVQRLADAGGQDMAHVSLHQGGFSLEDHWNAGAAALLQELKADVVVMQQGSSSTPANRDHLLFWTDRFTRVIRDNGGEPALYMVWPSENRLEAFPEVYTSYRTAADTVDGIFIPAGQTWVEAWALDDSLTFYAPDGLHQSYLGALAAAMTIYAVLFDVPAASVPALPDGVSEEVRATLRAALAESLATADPAPATGRVR